jgi:pyruvate dehydrogenase E2 component (dihydrolipoamide acetyltransferase)
MSEKTNNEYQAPDYTETNAPLLRKVIGKRLLESKLTIPHFYLFDEVNMEKASQFRKELNEGGKTKISYNDIIVKAGALALVKYKGCNVSYEDDKIRQYKTANINIAVSIEGGLLIPVLRNCEQKNLFQISEEAKVLVEKARSKKLRPREGMGGTFTISNLGVFGLEGSFSIINPPQALILTTGVIKEVPVVEDGKITSGLRMKITLSCDHRAIDGAIGAEFLVYVKTVLEDPKEYMG